jgi:carbamoyl-phosphate synthase/aspartate carbamoyltransferase/dihydroorotase
MYDNPRRIFDLPAQPDTWIEVDVNHKWTVRNEEMISRCGWTPFAGWELRGRVERVYLRGACVYENGKLSVTPGDGRNLAPAYRQSVQEITPEGLWELLQQPQSM